MKKVKKIMAAVSAAVMMFSISAVYLTANASPKYDKLDGEEWDFHSVKSYLCTNKNGEKKRHYTDIYYKATETGRGKAQYIERDYSKVVITVTPDVDKEELSAALNSEFICFADEDDSNQIIKNPDELAVEYDEQINYSDIYSIDGVEKVELVKMIQDANFCRYTVFENEDDWAKEKGYSLEYLMNNGSCPEDWKEKFGPGGSPYFLMMSTVHTNENVTLTPEMFADTGFTVEHIYEVKPSYWQVYFDYNGAESYIDFDLSTEKIDGVIESEIALKVSTTGLYSERQMVEKPSYAAKDLCEDNNSFTVSNLVYMQKYLTGSYETTIDKFKNLDLNNDGVTNVFDTIILRRMILSNNFYFY